MTVQDRLRQLASALPSDQSAVTFTRADLVALLDDDDGETGSESGRDMTVEEVAEETGRAPSTVRGWLLDRRLDGYKINNRDWRITRTALREFLASQPKKEGPPLEPGKVDITAWRRVPGPRSHDSIDHPQVGKPK